MRKVAAILIAWIFCSCVTYIGDSFYFYSKQPVVIYFSILLVRVAMSGKIILLEKSLLFIDAMSVH